MYVIKSVLCCPVIHGRVSKFSLWVWVCFVFWLTKSVLYQFWSTFKPPAASLLPCRFARDAKGTTVQGEYTVMQFGEFGRTGRGNLGWPPTHSHEKLYCITRQSCHPQKDLLNHFPLVPLTF